MNYPLIYITLFFISGIVLGRAFLFFPHSVSVLSAIVLILSLVINRGRTIKCLLLFFVGILGAFYYLFSSTVLPEKHISNFMYEDVILKGAVLRLPEKGPERITFYLGVEEIFVNEERFDTSGKVRLSGKIKTPLQYGDIILVRTKLKRPKGFHNPGGYDLEGALASDKVYAVGWVKDEDIGFVGFGGNRLLRGIYEKREEIRKAIDVSVRKESSAILQSMVIGEEKGLTDEVRDAFMASGTTHILSISGSHLGLLAFLIYNIVRISILRLPYRLLQRLTLFISPSKIAAISTMPPVILYAVIAGGQVATIRSLIMILVYLFAILIEREDRLINSLAFAALIILLINPQSLFDISFQLSYGSILSIGYLLDLQKEKRKSSMETKEQGRLPQMKKRLSQYLLVAIAATLGTAPLVAYYFNQFSWVGIFSNIVVIPLAGAVIVPLGLLSGFLTVATGSSTLPMAFIIDKAVFIFYFIVNTFSSIPHAAFRLPSPSIPLIGIYYMFFYTFLEWKRSRWIKIVGIISASLFVLLTIPFFLNGREGIKATFIDVGQGDSIFIELPDGKNMLIDGGGSFDKGFDIGRRVLAPYLWDKQIKGIDYVVLSHPHPDHMGGLRYIINKFRIGEVWLNGDSDVEGYAEFLKLIKEREIPVTIVIRGDALLTKDYNIYILHPYPEFFPGSPRGEFSDQNNRSIVLKLEYKDHSFLFPGDIEKEAEDDLIHLEKWLKANVIKVPHHGGKTSSTEEFLFMVKPEIAVVSSGRDNIFRHPAKDIINRYEELGIRLYRTDRDGAIILESDGNKLDIKTFNTISFERITLNSDWWPAEKRNIKRVKDMPFYN